MMCFLAESDVVITSVLLRETWVYVTKLSVLDITFISLDWTEFKRFAHHGPVQGVLG